VYRPSKVNVKFPRSFNRINETAVVQFDNVIVY